MTTRFDLEGTWQSMDPVMIERLRARIARRPGRWRRRMGHAGPRPRDRAELLKAA